MSLPTLKGITFNAQPGDVIGIIGPSGSGKSTLARVIAGVWPAMSGKVKLDGADLTQWDESDPWAILRILTARYYFV